MAVRPHARWLSRARLCCCAAGVSATYKKLPITSKRRDAIDGQHSHRPPTSHQRRQRMGAASSRPRPSRSAQRLSAYASLRSRPLSQIARPQYARPPIPRPQTAQPAAAETLRNRNGDEVTSGRDDALGLSPACASDAGESDEDDDDDDEFKDIHVDIPAADLFYCGQNRGQCWCGHCDGVCGPDAGCPCDACLALVGIAVNRLGRVARYSHSRLAPAKDLLYCGHVVHGVRCSPRADPCLPCIELAASDLFGSREFRRPDGRSAALPRAATDLSAADAAAVNRTTRLPASKTFQCGARLPDGGGTCRSDGTVCAPCRALSLTVRAASALVLNDDGHLATLGSPAGATGASDAIPAARTYYCGRECPSRRCRCRGAVCPPRCGPLSGCPCDSCRRITLAVERADWSFAQQLRNPAGFLVRWPGDPPANAAAAAAAASATATNGTSTAAGAASAAAAAAANADRIFYCGRLIPGRKCACDDCGPVCGPYTGCPCSDCLRLMTEAATAAAAAATVGGSARRSSSAPPPADRSHASRTRTARRSRSPQPSASSVPSVTRQARAPASVAAPAAATATTAAAATADANLCIVCVSAPKSHVLVPCGHQTLCGACAEKVSSCPLCRRTVTARVK
ncbi:hypothetical protein HK405_008817, partial [Cladochytrium tenue]